MSTEILDRLRGFQIPVAVPIPADRFYIARLTGLDFEGLLRSPDLGLEQPFDGRYAKTMVRTASHLLGGDACGCYGFVEQTEFSVLFSREELAARWNDANVLQNYLVGLASTKLSALVETEAIFACQLFAFNTADLAISYLVWRQQEANTHALDAYCLHVLSQETEPEKVVMLLEDLGPREKKEILNQNNVDYEKVPGWQRWGTGVRLQPDGTIDIETSLPLDSEYLAYVQKLMS